MQNDLAGAVVNRGNWSRLKSCMQRAEQGERIRVGFLGGSITQGSAASEETCCYAWLNYQWWCERFPEAEIEYVNSGIGGTTSLFGAARVWTDMLRYRPDVVVVDFTVNDEGNEFFQETFEGVVRRLYDSESRPAVIVLNNVFYDTGKSAQDYHNAVASHYGLPCVSMREGLYEEIQKGRYRREEITEDNLHPIDYGHRQLASRLNYLLEQVYEEREEKEEELPVPKPLTENAYEQVTRYQIGNSNPKLDGFCVDTRKKCGYLDHFKDGWIGKKCGDRIEFQITCRNLAIQYKKAVNGPVPKARLVIDGDEKGSMILDGNFDETWGDCLYLQSVLHHGEQKEHSVVIEIVSASEEDKEPFYLMSLICS